MVGLRILSSVREKLEATLGQPLIEETSRTPHVDRNQIACWVSAEVEVAVPQSSLYCQYTVVPLVLPPH